MIRSRADRRMFVRRRFAVAVALAASMAAVWAVGARAQSVRSADTVIVVQPGETLWALGERYAPAGSDLRRWTARVEQVNHLGGEDLTAGQELRLPS